MEVVYVDDNFGAKQDSGTDVNVNASGVRVTIANPPLPTGTARADVALSTTAAAILTGAASEFLQLSHVIVINTGASTRVVTLYLERNDSTPEYAATDVWTIITLLANEHAEWTPGTGWVIHDSAGRPYGFPAMASQADQETGTSVVVVVTPGVQHFHPSSAKEWGVATVSGAVPTLQVSYNTTSITDTATDRLTVTIGTDFSTANYSIQATIEAATTTYSATTTSLIVVVRNATKAAGSFVLDCVEIDIGQATDPASWSWACFGDL